MNNDFKPSAKLITAAEHLLVAIAHEDTIRPVVMAYTKSILDQHQFEPDAAFAPFLKPGTRITPENCYLLSPQDQKTFDAACTVAKKCAGLDRYVTRPNNCPLLEAELFRRAAEASFVQALGELPQLTVLTQCNMNTPEINTQLAELGLRLLAPFVGTPKAILLDFVKDSQQGDSGRDQN